jgi:glycosyltransferase involved in cell wall biosynthesis
MRIGMEFRDNSISNIDFSDVTKGNPGCGGTQYEFALLAHHLLIIHPEYEIFFFHVSENTFEKGIKSVKLNCIEETPKAAKDCNIDLLIFWSTHDDKWYRDLDHYHIKSIAWSHNFLNYPEIQRIEKCKNVKCVVSVSKEQYKLLSGESIFGKCTYIYNMYDFEPENYDRSQALKDNIVCCTGTLIKAKGFHLLARYWKDITRCIPNAQLYVMGDGKLWNSGQKLGRFNLAESSYEKSFMRYLTDQDGKILDSVHFLGNVGQEKNQIYRKCKVGVVNPTGVETFCISAVEMEAEGVPVCSINKNGLKDSIQNNNTGLLGKSSRDVRNNIIKLLSDDVLNRRFSENARKFAQKFNGNNIIIRWDKLISAVAFENASIEALNHDEFISKINVRSQIRKIHNYRAFKFLPTPYKISYNNYLFKVELVKLRNHVLSVLKMTK